MDKLKNRIQENIHKMDVDEPVAATWDHIKHGLSESREKDTFKTRIAANKTQLDVETPDAQSWEEISRIISIKKPAPVKRIKKGLMYLSAACIITILSFGVFRYMNITKTNTSKKVVKTTLSKPLINANDTTNLEPDKSPVVVKQPLTVQSLNQEIKHKSIAIASSKPAKKQRESLPPVVMQIEKDYDQLIAGQIAYIKNLAVYGENASYFQEFMNDFKTLDKQEKLLRKSIAEHGLGENSIDELGMIYQQKLTVLKKLQNEINKTSSRNKNLTDTIPTYISL